LKKTRKDEDSERFALLAKVQSLEKEIQELKAPKPQTWDTITTGAKVLSAPGPEAPKAPIMQGCSVCGRLFNLRDADMAQRFSPWAELKGLKNFAKEGFLYVSCSLECSQKVSQLIDQLAVNAIKVNIGSIS
jgi:hypothetical protein